MMNKKYQIVEILPQQVNAGAKAPSDIEKIAYQLGFKTCKVSITSNNKFNLINKIKNQFEYFSAWNGIYSKIEPDSIVFIQYPKYQRQLNRYNTLKRLKKNKNIRIICLIHDINILRGENKNSSLNKEFSKVLKLSDQIIVHNKKMMRYVNANFHIPQNRLINLEIFDYLTSNLKNYMAPSFDRSVIIAGNLSLKKSKYLNFLNKIKIKFYLYGSNFSLSQYNNVVYEGFFSPNKANDYLKKGFGLVWDGTSIKSCKGVYGNYLRYNDPHKLSLYLSVGLPVIIWSKAAEAKFVKKNRVGILIDNLLDLPKELKKISPDGYALMTKNARNISKKLRSGWYTKRAIKQAVINIEKRDYNK